MSDLNLPQKNNTAQNEPTPGTMPITILLLVGGLLLTSAMMVNYTLGTKNIYGKTTVNVSALTENLKEKIIVMNASSSLKKEKTEELLPVQWPELTLTGFGTGIGGKDGFAFINGQSVVPGQKLNTATEEEAIPVKIIKVVTQGVLVECGGEQKLLTVKATIQTLEPY